MGHTVCYAQIKLVFSNISASSNFYAAFHIKREIMGHLVLIVSAFKSKYAFRIILSYISVRDLLLLSYKNMFSL